MANEMEKTVKNEKTKSPSKIDAKLIGSVAPYVGLVLVIIIFTVLTKGALLSTNNIQAMVNQVIVVALVTLGAVFVFGAGFFDMSLGATVCFSALMGGYTAIATGSYLLAFVVILVVALLMGLLKGIFAAKVNVPFFIFTIVLSSVISSVVLVIMGSETTILLSSAVKEMPTFNFSQMSGINAVALGIFFVLTVVLFNYTPLGIKVKNMGGNIRAAQQSGIAVKKTTVEVFLVSALGCAIAAFVILLRTRSVSGTTASGVGNDVMVALVLGGMPLSGGPKSKISAGIVGALTITILNSGLTIMGLSTGAIQICRGLVFICCVLVASLSYRGKLLPR